VPLSSIDFTKDIRYQQGVGYVIKKGGEQGIEATKIESAINLIKEGFDLAVIQRTIGLPKTKVEELAAQIAETKKR
jgi:precorrin-6x reductase